MVVCYRHPHVTAPVMITVISKSQAPKSGDRVNIETDTWYPENGASIYDHGIS